MLRITISREIVHTHDWIQLTNKPTELQEIQQNKSSPCIDVNDCKCNVSILVNFNPSTIE